MSRLTTAVSNDLKLLELMRDELALQAHLLKADAKDKWQELENKWADLKRHIENAAAAGDAAEHEAKTAVGLLSESLRSGYDGIRKALKN